MAESTIKKTSNLKWISLWTNPSPSATFAANQTISINNLSAYSEVCFRVKSVNTGDAIYSLVVPLTTFPMSGVILTVITGEIRQRYGITIQNNSINFGAAGVFNNYGGSRTENTSSVIPVEVLGR